MSETTADRVRDKFDRALDEMEAEEVVSAQPPKEDGRRFSSPQNGRKGGRPPLDYGDLAERYKVANETIVRWYKGEYYEYNRRLGVYIRNTEKMEGARVGAFLKSELSPISYSANAERNVVGALRATYETDLVPPMFVSTRKSAVGWVSMRNGLLDIEAAARGEKDCLHPHTPDFFSTYALPYEWNPEAACPRFERFVQEVQPDEKGRDMMQMLGGLLLVPDTSYNVFFILLGEGGCGKSTFLKILAAALGPDNVCSVPLSMFAEKHTTHRLTRALANFVEDSPTVDGRSLASIEGVLKQVTDGALMHVEPKGIDPWEAPATARCVFCQNPPLPQFLDRSEAIWDRLRVIPFKSRIRGTEGQNPKLVEEITAEELPGILLWMAKGLGRLRQLRQFPQCGEGKSLIQEHRETCDREKLFLSDRYKEMNGQFTPSGDVYRAYQGWCLAEGYQPKNNGNFKQDVLRVFPGVKAVNMRYIGKMTRGYLNLVTMPGLEDEE